jgi:hypothetical protein
VEFILQREASGEVYSFPQEIDPRTWKPGQKYAVEATLALPANMAPGAYRLGLYLPDVSPRLRADPHYAYRVANEGVWDEESGFNILAEGILIGE